MNQPASSFNPTSAGAELPHYAQVSPSEVVTADPASTVSEVGQSVHPMSDEEREAAARRAGVAMQTWYEEYRRTGDQLCLKVAHHHMNQMVQILAGRSPEYVAKLERDRGLA